MRFINHEKNEEERRGRIAEILLLPGSEYSWSRMQSGRTQSSSWWTQGTNILAGKWATWHVRTSSECWVIQYEKQSHIYRATREVGEETDTYMGKAPKSLFVDDLKLDGDMISISRCHRLENTRKQHNRSCYSIVRFKHYSDRQEVFYGAKHLKGEIPHHLST